MKGGLYVKRRIKMFITVFLIIFIIAGVAFVSLSSGTQKIEESIEEQDIKEENSDEKEENLN